MLVEEFDEIEDILRRLARRTTPPNIFVGGSYEGTTWDSVAVELGTSLSELDVTVVSGSEKPGRRISYAVARALNARSAYAADRIVLYARTNADKKLLADEPFGTIVFFGRTKEEKRREMLRTARLTILVAGAAGTAEEARMSDEIGVPVVPLAFTGGAAQLYREAARSNSAAVSVGDVEIDNAEYELLNNATSSIAIHAAMRIIRSVLGL